MAGTDKRGLRLAWKGDTLFLKNDALILAQDGGPGIAARAAIANGWRYILDLVAM